MIGEIRAACKLDGNDPVQRETLIIRRGQILAGVMVMILIGIRCLSRGTGFS